MKTIARFILTTITSVFSIHATTAQSDNINNITGKLSAALQIDQKLLNPDTASSACNTQNNFWGFDFNNNFLLEFDLTNNVITYTGHYVANCPGVSLAICNNLNGGTQIPTYYTSMGDSVFYWNGSVNWVLTGPAPIILANAYGFGSDLYFLNPVGITTQIIKYDGSAFTAFFTSAKVAGIADFACDATGNVWLLTRAGVSNLLTDSLIAISPAGQIIHQYAIALPTSYAYGCAMINGVYYVAYSPSAWWMPYSNCLVPVTVSGDSAIAGNAIQLPFPYELTNDLASCNPGNPLGMETLSQKNEWSVSPNPAKDMLVISYPLSGKQEGILSITGISGKEVLKSEICNPKFEINISSLAPGIYFIRILTQKSFAVKKFIVGK